MDHAIAGVTESRGGEVDVGGVPGDDGRRKAVPERVAGQRPAELAVPEPLDRLGNGLRLDRFSGTSYPESACIRPAAEQDGAECCAMDFEPFRQLGGHIVDEGGAILDPVDEDQLPAPPGMAEFLTEPDAGEVFQPEIEQRAERDDQTVACFEAEDHVGARHRNCIERPVGDSQHPSGVRPGDRLAGGEDFGTCWAKRERIHPAKVGAGEQNPES